MSLLSKQLAITLVTIIAVCALSATAAWAADKGLDDTRKTVSKSITVPTRRASITATKFEYTFEQRDVEVGQTTVYLSKNAVRVVNHDHGFEIITSAPDWKISFIRRAEKKQYTTTLKEFRYFSVFGQLDTDWNRYEHLPILAHQVKDGLSLAKYYTPAAIEIYMIENIDIAPEVGYFLQCYYHLPLSGVPYRSVYHFPRESRKRETSWLKSSGGDFAGQKQWLSTVSQKKSAYLASDFECPTGFATVKDQTVMILSNSKQSAFDSMLKEITAEDKSRQLQRLRKTAQP